MLTRPQTLGLELPRLTPRGAEDSRVARIIPRRSSARARFPPESARRGGPSHAPAPGMVTINRILCPVDLSDTSRRALDYAVAIARWYGASVTAMRAIPLAVPVMSYAGELYRMSAVTSAADLEIVRRGTAEFVGREAGPSPIETIVMEGDAGTIIAEQAREGFDLIVMGTHGHRGFDRVMLGSVAERVLRSVSCPVLTVPPAAPDAVPIRPGLFTDIVCGVDFAPASDAAARLAISLAEEADAHLTLVHAIEHPLLWPLPANARDAETLKEAVESEALRRLTALVPEEARQFAHISLAIKSGKAYRALLETAASRKADLIVLGAHGGLPGLLAFGSTTNHVVREAACPVLTLRP